MKIRGNHVLKQNLGQFYPLWEARAPWVRERERGMKIWSQAQSCAVEMLNLCKSLLCSSGSVWSQPPDHFAADLQWVTKPLAVLLSYFLSCPKFLCPSFFLNHLHCPLHWLCQAAAASRAVSQSLVSLTSNSKNCFVLTFCAQGNSSEQERKRHRRFLLQPVRLGKVSIENLEHKSRRHDLILLLVPLVLHKKLSKIFSTSFSSKKREQ